MHFRDLSSITSSTYPNLDYHSAARFIIEQQFAPDRPTRDMRHLVDMPDLTPSRFKTLAQYHRAVARRRAWCEKFAYGGHVIDQLHGDAEHNGLRFRFAVGPVATLFGLLFGTARAPRSATSD